MSWQNILNMMLVSYKMLFIMAVKLL